MAETFAERWLRLAEPVTAAVSIPTLPAAHFTREDPDPGTPLQITDDGRIFGLVAPAGVCHRGAPGCVTLETLEAAGPIDWEGGHSSMPLRLDDGTEVRTVALTMRGGHPDTHLTAAQARAHHDDTATVVADVVAWRSPAGLAVSGSVRPDLTDADLREMMGAAPSVEIWPTADRGRVLLGIQLVPSPAWPVAASADEPVISTPWGGVERCDCDGTEVTVEDRIATLERVAVERLAAI